MEGSSTQTDLRQEQDSAAFEERRELKLDILPQKSKPQKYEETVRQFTVKAESIGNRFTEVLKQNGVEEIFRLPTQNHKLQEHTESEIKPSFEIQDSVNRFKEAGSKQNGIETAFHLSSQTKHKQLGRKIYSEVQDLESRFEEDELKQNGVALTFHIPSQNEHKQLPRKFSSVVQHLVNGSKENKTKQTGTDEEYFLPTLANKKSSVSFQKHPCVSPKYSISSKIADDNGSVNQQTIITRDKHLLKAVQQFKKRRATIAEGNLNPQPVDNRGLLRHAISVPTQESMSSGSKLKRRQSFMQISPRRLLRGVSIARGTNRGATAKFHAALQKEFSRPKWPPGYVGF